MRPSIEDRMDRWLNDQADASEIPDHLRQRFIDRLRGTSAFAAARLSMLLRDLGARIAAGRGRTCGSNGALLGSLAPPRRVTSDG